MLTKTSMEEPRFTDLDHGITAIDTCYTRPIAAASHLIVENGKAAFVDTGTSHAVPILLEVLKRKNIDAGDVDYVFLTHIHLDHAGGAGLLMQALPNAMAVLHPRGARHMVDPQKLVAGTIAVYGKEKYLELYGDITAIDADRIQVTEDGTVVEFCGRPFEFIYTPGHALHHHCIIDGSVRGIFSGDTFGVSYRELDTEQGEFIFPTTTPVHFDPDALHRSVDRLMSYAPDAIYLTHYSRVGNLGRLASDMHRHIDAFVAIARTHADAVGRTTQMEADMYDYLSACLDAHGVTGDEARRHAILDMDITLNVQGLEVWLNRQKH